jgi:hypothetical protein
MNAKDGAVMYDNTVGVNSVPPGRCDFQMDPAGQNRPVPDGCGLFSNSNGLVEFALEYH